jgi:hypothetical protein
MCFPGFDNILPCYAAETDQLLITIDLRFCTLPGLNQFEDPCKWTFAKVFGDLALISQVFREV